MKERGNFRINLFFGITILASSLILYRLFILSVIRHSAYSRVAQAQNENISNILARGNIYLTDKDKNLHLAATNRKFPLAYIIPADISQSEGGRISEALSGILGLNQDEIRSKIDSRTGSLRVIARKVTAEQINQIKDLKTKGVGVSYEADRFYPGGSISADIIGFLGYDADGKRAGQYGIEGFYNQDLFGKSPGFYGLFATANSPDLFGYLKRLIAGGKSANENSVPEFDQPADVVLTIDKNVQVFIEDRLKSVVEKWQAEKGVIMVQEPESGRIIAMADWPNFNPNDYSHADSEHFLNQAIQGIYEPGSSFKPVTIAAGLDLSKVTPRTSYEDRGFVQVGNYTIHNFSEKVFGVQTMTQVLEKSINTGVMFVENLVGDENFLNYVINMGFGQKTGVDLPGEVSGDITNLYSGRKINYLTSSFGQGIAVTPLQLLNVYSMIANGGKLMRPYVADKIIKERGQETATVPEVVSIPISEKTAVKLQSMLVSVVDNGFDRARIRGYDIAGKTGTAQIPDGRGGYSDTDFIHNFVGFAPAYNAKFTILIKMDKPKGIQFAADSLSPVFRDIAEYLINYYNIPPTRK